MFWCVGELSGIFSVLYLAHSDVSHLGSIPSDADSFPGTANYL